MSEVVHSEIIIIIIIIIIIFANIHLPLSVL